MTTYSTFHHKCSAGFHGDLSSQDEDSEIQII